MFLLQAIRRLSYSVSKVDECPLKLFCFSFCKLCGFTINTILLEVKP